MNSINTNIAAMVALKNLNSTNMSLTKVQNRVSTGFRVASAVDDGGAFAVAQGLRGDIAASDAVNQQLNVAKGTVGVALEASTSISDTLNVVRTTLTKLADAGISDAQREQYKKDFDAQMLEAENFVKNAKYNGKSLIDAAANDIDVISNASGETYKITKQDLETTITALKGATPADSDAAKKLLDGTDDKLKDAIAATDNALNAFGATTRRLDSQIKFNTAVRDATEAGLGAVVDADLARESALLTALQTRQQLGIQTLGIANQTPSALLGLFG